MPFQDSFPLRACGPRSDLSVVYGRFTVSNSGATLTASADTTSGLAITGDTGVYVLTHRKCRFRHFSLHLDLATIATVADARQLVMHVPVAGTDDAASGVLNFNTIEHDTASAVSEPPDGAVIVVFGILGF